jgi:hypothetical protein
MSEETSDVLREFTTTDVLPLDESELYCLGRSALGREVRERYDVANV